MLVALSRLGRKSTCGRTKRCTEVADRPLPDGKFFGRDIGDRGRSSVEASLQYTQHQWAKLIEEYPPGTNVSGTVRARQQFGVYVLLDELPDVPSLLEIIHFHANESSPKQKIQFPVDYPSVGETITARILAWSEKTKDVRLTQLSHLNWIPEARSIQNGGNDH